MEIQNSIDFDFDLYKYVFKLAGINENCCMPKKQLLRKEWRFIFILSNKHLLSKRTMDARKKNTFLLDCLTMHRCLSFLPSKKKQK